MKSKFFKYLKYKDLLLFEINLLQMKLNAKWS
jgi:hypothetical protein